MQADTTVVLERQPRRRVGVQLLGLALLAAFVIPAGTFAGKGGGGTATQPWIALAAVDGTSALSAAAQPRLGSAVKFATGYPNGTRNPWVSVMCFQGDTLVYGEGGKPGSEFGLGGASSLWLQTGGAASCRAELGDLYWRGGQQYYTYLAETWFDAAA